MAGLGGMIDQPQPIQGRGGKAAMPAGNVSQQQNTDANIEEAGPEEQASYNRFVSMAVMGLSDKNMLDKTIATMSSAGEPTEGVAEVVSAIIIRIMSMAKEQGSELTGDVLMNGGKEVVEYGIELAEAASIAEFTPDMMDETFFRVLDIVTTALKSTGDLDEEAIASDLPIFQQMEANGGLDQMLAQLDQAQQAESQAEQPQMTQGQAAQAEGV